MGDSYENVVSERTCCKHHDFRFLNGLQSNLNGSSATGEMAFILKSSKFMCNFWGFTREANLTRFHNGVYDLLSRSLQASNGASFRKFSLQSARVTTPDMLGKAIYQLQIDASNTKKISLRDVEEILETIKDSKTINYHESIVLLKCCGSSFLALNSTERKELLQKVLNQIENSGLKVDIKHYNVLLNIYLENEFNFSPSEFLENLQEKNLEPSKITYQHLLKAYCQQGDISSASNLLETMKNNDMNLNEDIFNSLILGHCQVNDLEGAKGILSLMEKKGIEPTSESYINFLCGYAKIGDIDEIRKIMSECKNKSIMFLVQHIFKLVYELAINNHFEFIDEILGKVKNSYKYTPQVHLFVNKLLEKKLDRVALKIYKSAIKNNVVSASNNHGNYLIEFFVKYRSDEDVLSFCKELEKEGFVFAPVACALKQVLLLKDSSKALDFFSAMKKEHLPVRSHYFWPLIINASTEGNKSVLDILMKMKKMGVNCCASTALRILYSHYKFGTDWLDDIEKLQNAGVSKLHISRNLLKFLISSGNVEDVEKLTATMPVSVNPIVHTRLLIEFMEKTKNADFLVNVMYNLLHDFRAISIESSSKADSHTDPEETEGKIENEHDFVSKIIRSLMINEKNDLLKQVLQKMLEKKIGISSALSAEIREKLSGDEADSLLDKLTDENLLMEFDENLLSLKKRDSASVNFDEKMNEDNLNFWRNCQRISRLVKAGFIEKAMNQCRNFLFEYADYEFNRQDVKAYKIFLMALANNAHYETVAEAFKIGVKMAVIEPRNFYPLVHALIVRGNLEEATNVFCQKSLELRCSSSWSNLVTKLIENENADLLQKVTNAVSRIKNEDFSMGMLLSQLAKLQKVKEITKLTESSNFSFTMQCIDYCCSWLLQNESFEGFETLLTATVNNERVDRANIYYYLLRACMAVDDVSKVKNALSRLKEENIVLRQAFLNKVDSYLQEKEEFNEYLDNQLQKNNKQTGEKMKN